MSNRNLFLICFLVIIYSCAPTSSELPENSVTLLLNKKTDYPNLQEPSPSNIDIINGFRGLRINSLIDSLYLEDWLEKRTSPNIIAFRKDMPIVVSTETHISNIELEFFKEELISLKINFPDLPHYKKNKPFNEDDASWKILEPHIITTYYDVFGKQEWERENNGVLDYEDISLYDAAVAMVNGKEPKVRSNPFSDAVIYRNTQTPSTIINQNYFNTKRLSYTGVKNEMTLEILNHFEIDKPEGKLFFSYLLKRIGLFIHIYDKLKYEEYQIAKANIETEMEEQQLKQNLKESQLRDRQKMSSSSSEL